MEQETKRFYEAAAQKSTSAPVRQLLSDLAQEEDYYVRLAEKLEQQQLESGERKEGGRQLVERLFSKWFSPGWPV